MEEEVFLLPGGGWQWGSFGRMIRGPAQKCRKLRIQNAAQEYRQFRIQVAAQEAVHAEGLLNAQGVCGCFRTLARMGVLQTDESGHPEPLFAECQGCP